MFFVVTILTLLSLVVHTTTGTFAVDREFVQNFINASFSYWAQIENPQFQLDDFMDNDIRSCAPQADWTCLKGKKQVMNDMDTKRKLVNHINQRVFNLNVYSRGFSGDIELYDIRWGQNCMVTSMSGSFMVRVNDAGKVIEHYCWLDDADMYRNFWSAVQKRECLRQDFMPRSAVSFTTTFCRDYEDFFNNKNSGDRLFNIMSNEAIVCVQGDCSHGQEEFRQQMSTWRNILSRNRIYCEVMYASETPLKSLTIRWSWLYSLVDRNDDLMMMGTTSLVLDGEGKILIELDNTSEQSFSHLMNRNVQHQTQQGSSPTKKEM